MRKYLIILFCLLAPLSFALAAEDFYLFQSHEEKQRFDTLSKSLRCLVCQNQTLAESNAPLANDLREQIFQQLENGQTDKQIIDYLVSRYGNFILYRPPFNITTLGLWLGPFAILIAGLSFLFYYLRKNQRA